MNEVSKSLCAVCRTAATQRCSGCRNIFYCSREHQKCHWKEHSKNCKYFKLAVDSRLGRHYIATRMINAGEIVLKDEIPLVSGPPANTLPVCLGCYVVLTGNTARACVNCGWPLCEDCTSHGPECNFTRKYKSIKVSITDYGYPHPTYNCITAVRALSLRTENPDYYQKFLDLEDHCELVKNEANPDFDLRNGALNLAHFIKRFFNLLDEEISEEEIARIARILQVNGHEVPTTDPFHVAVYHQASYLEHNCHANCSKSFTDAGGLIVRAALPISKGEHLSICYTDPLWGVTNRRHHLAKTKFFDCICERCTDPTEYGTMFNAVACFKRECDGNMLPPTFLYEADYVCSQCGLVTSCEQVEKILERIGMDLAEIKKDDIAGCKNFLMRHARSLHENHFYKIDVKVALAQIIGQQNAGLPAIDDDLLNEKILLCKKINDLLKILAPAETRIRGLILFEMHAALAEFGRRREKDELAGILLVRVKVLENRDATLVGDMESKKVLAEALELLRHEPKILPEGQIAIHARKNLQDIEAIITALCRNAASPL